MKVFPNTIKELRSTSTRAMLRAVISDEQDGCTNIYTPKYKELCLLYKWVDNNVPDERVHDKQKREVK